MQEITFVLFAMNEIWKQSYTFKEFCCSTTEKQRNQEFTCNCNQRVQTPKLISPYGEPLPVCPVIYMHMNTRMNLILVISYPHPTPFQEQEEENKGVQWKDVIPAITATQMNSWKCISQ